MKFDCVEAFREVVDFASSISFVENFELDYQDWDLLRGCNVHFQSWFETGSLKVPSVYLPFMFELKSLIMSFAFSHYVYSFSFLSQTADGGRFAYPTSIFFRVDSSLYSSSCPSFFNGLSF